MVGQRARIFIDFWNFQLSWNERASNGDKCDWTQLPMSAITTTSHLLAKVGQTVPLELEETLLYASVDPLSDGNLKRWLTTFLDRQPSWRVHIRERRPQPRQFYCRHCRSTTERCPACGERYITRPEKGVDAAIVTDLLSLAWQNAFDVAVLLSSDADFVPAVERVQERGLKVVNGGWSRRGHELKAACWASFELDPLMAGIRR